MPNRAFSAILVLLINNPKNMTLDQQFIEKMKNKLMEEKGRIEGELKRFANKDKHDKEAYNPRFPDMTDKLEESAAEVAQFVDELALEGSFEQTLKAIDHASDKINAGTYGICDVCKKEIDPKRLEANPSAATCVEHAK